jgi:hypothetical protein
MFFFDVGAGVPASIISAPEPRVGDITRDNPPPNEVCELDR